MWDEMERTPRCGSAAKEEYIETIHELEEMRGIARTGEIAERLGIKASSVTEMLRRLDEEGYVHYLKYRGARLTEKGYTVAMELKACQRVLADFLRIIGVPPEEAERDACRLEHHLSLDTVTRLRDFIEYLHEEGHLERYRRERDA